MSDAACSSWYGVRRRDACSGARRRGIHAGSFAASVNTDIALAHPLERNSFVADAEHYCLTLALYFEGGSSGESERGQRHIARVIMERVRANREIWGGDTVCGVVFQQSNGVCQFSFACRPEAGRTPRKGSAWALSAAIARDALEGRNNGPHHSIHYYMNAELSDARNVCWFRRALVRVVQAGSHEFFREPTAEERTELANRKVEACQAAAVQARKAKAKLHVAKTSKSKKKLAGHPKAKGKHATKALKSHRAARTRIARARR